MIKVSYDMYSTMFSINKILKYLNNANMISFDVETRSIYSQDNIKEAKDLLKVPGKTETVTSFLIMVSKTSGLSFPSLVKTTHFIFGLSKDKSVLIIADNKKIESAVWNWVADYKGKLLVHNSSFDLKICHQRTGKIPVNFEDTQLLAKCYLNNAENWKAKVGLKTLMEAYYDPKWGMFEDYNIQNLRDENFLEYAAIDGAATYHLYELLQQEKLNWV